MLWNGAQEGKSLRLCFLKQSEHKILKHEYADNIDGIPSLYTLVAFFLVIEEPPQKRNLEGSIQVVFCLFVCFLMESFLNPLEF